MTLRALHGGMVKSKALKADQKLIQERKDNGYVFPPALEHKIEDIIDGLRPGFLKLLHNISPENTTIIAEYILAMKTEINLSDHYRQDNIIALCELSKYFDNKPFKSITNRDRIIAFLDRFRKSESLDPMHKWIGTYNTYRIYLLRFFKWLYYPNIESDKRPKPDVVQNIPMLKRKEKSVYKPTDLWTAEDDFLFFKYCPSKRMKCYHAVTRDTACRPHEILKLRIKDVQFKTAINGQYAEVFVNGKTGTRHLPLIDSIPFVKDYLDYEHPQPTNPEAAFIAGTKKSLTKKLQPASIHKIYENFKKDYFPKLLGSTNVPHKDKQKIKDLLKKPWNPYIRRHSALTNISSILKESDLRVLAGWTSGSEMPRRYIHKFGNEACESILVARGIITKDHQMSNQLQSKQCPNCSEINKPDSKFCAKCRMVLTYDAYSETIEGTQKKESEVKELKEKYEKDMTAMREEMEDKFKQILAKIDIATLK